VPKEEKSNWYLQLFAIGMPSNDIHNMLVKNTRIIQATLSAAQRGYIEIIDLIVAIGVPLDRISIDGNNIAHYAAMGNQDDILRLLKNHYFLLEKRNRKGNSPLQIAFAKGNLQVSNFLVEAHSSHNTRLAEVKKPNIGGSICDSRMKLSPLSPASKMQVSKTACTSFPKQLQYEVSPSEGSNNYSPVVNKRKTVLHQQSWQLNSLPSTRCFNCNSCDNTKFCENLIDNVCK